MIFSYRKHSHLLNELVFLLIFVHTGYSFDCKHDDTDLSRLTGTWISRTDDTTDKNFTYKISLCSALTPNGANDQCPPSASICLIYDNGTALSAGNFNSSADQLGGGVNEEEGDMWLIFPGDPCPDNKLYNLTTSINFKCGPTLGSPKFLSYDGCVSYFEWETIVYCKNPPLVNEARCYLYDDKWNRYDLSPLTKSKGGYLVSSEGSTDFYINVCREITEDSLTTGCPKGSGACRKDGLTYENFGVVNSNDGLKRGVDGNIRLKYSTSTSDTLPPGCTSPPSTTITFICPRRRENKDPLIVSSFDCQYVIEWQTEYACPETKLSNNSCVLTKAGADIDIDLRPLRKQKGEPYQISYTDPSSTKNAVYDFYLNVCEELELPCPDDDHIGHIPACQTLQGQPLFGKAMGSTDHMRLSYADGELTLTYKGGELCNHNRFKRQTIINFICDQTAGNGQPEYIRENDCTYFFEWKTRYACLDHPRDEACRVNYKGQRYDMSSLVKSTGVNWQALHENNEKYGTGNYYINICHNILQTEGASRCDPGAAICYRETQSTFNLGRYESAPVYNNITNSTQITYTNGDICKGSTRRSSTINFYCKQGESESAPVLIDKTDDTCFYTFEWHTESACALKKYHGTNCQIHADGISFDLTPLKKAPGGSYTVDSNTDVDHEYFINICGPVIHTNCDNLGIKDVGICQQPVAGKSGDSFVTGQWTSEMTYYDGMINLTYVGGTPYHNAAQTPRRSEIVFICDLDADIGTPIFMSEVQSDHYYAFEWRTSYACPHAPVQCSIVDPKTGKEYDLSGLTRLPSQDNWSIKGPGTTKYYINVCQPLNKVGGNLCDPFAAFCRTTINNNEEQAELRDMGHVIDGVKIEGDNRLSLTYEGGSCNNGSATVPYRTNIQFLCRQGALSTTPGVPLQDGPCEYTVLWDTVAACPLINDNDTEKCTARDVNNNYIYNMSPLTRDPSDPYIIRANGIEFKINICGKVSDCPDVYEGQSPSVCKSFIGNDTKIGLTGLNSKLDFSEDGGMSLVTYGNRSGDGQLVTVKIIFLCAKDTEMGTIMFVRQMGNVYIFNFLTSLACMPLATECVVQDEAGNQYDLTSLEKDTYWNVADSRDDHTTYYINVCRPVNNAPDSKCPDSPIGGCQVASNGGVYNMGYIQAKPIAHSDGSITIRYRNGDLCHEGTDRQAHRSTRINLFCSDNEDGPVFETETETCEYVFNWRTPAACAVKTSVGGNCKVVEPRYKFEFDLNLLHQTSTDYKVYSPDGYKYLINVCGPLHESGGCDLKTGVGVCQTKNDTNFTPVNAGIANSELQYDNGQLMLIYKGGQDKCHGQYERQTFIRFVCDFSTEGRKGPTFIEESYNCHYVFEWATNMACPPHTASSCTVNDNAQNSYDLNVLSLLNDNYEVVDSMEKKRYIINVCRSLVHKPNATCPYSAAACMVDLDKPDSDPKKYQSIGAPVASPLRYENGQIVLVYTNGDICKNGKDRMSTHITFKCDKNALHSVPVGHFMVGDCDHHFLWQSAAACSDEIIDDKTDTDVKPQDITCKVTDPATGTVFDLSQLRITDDSSWSVTDKQGHKYEFNVCGPLKNSACKDAGDSIGVCQSSTDSSSSVTYNAGNSVHDLWYDDGVIIQNYTGGAKCHNGKYERNTIITFICNQHRGIGRPMFIDETEDCTYYISWHTSLVCENEIRCSVENNDLQTIDLTPLTRDPDHVIYSTDDNTKFYLSICSALTLPTGVLCPYGAGVCQVKNSDGKMHTSLGSPKSSPTYNSKTNEVQLLYTNGSRCDTDPTKNYTSRIIFSCLPGPVRSRPTFARKSDCEYIFNWPTATVCTETPSDECGYHDINNQEYYDLSKLQESTPLEVDVDGDRYLINMCGGIDSDDTSSCNGHMVCRQKDGLSFGEPKQYHVVQEEGVLKMFYAVGGNCSDGSTAHSSFLFRCDRTVEKGQPMKWASIGCDVVFDWPTNVVCPSIQKSCSITVDDHYYDLSLLTKTHGAWNLTDSNNNMYV
ncbi:Cation-independent mannose-6-phosphate receptor [Mactra antiquata]